MKNSRLMDYPHAALTIRRLGELHAYSFALRAADPASFDRLKQMEEPMFPRQDSVREARIPQEKVDLVAKVTRPFSSFHRRRIPRRYIYN